MQFFLPNLNLSIIKSNDLVSKCIEGIFCIILLFISSFFFYSYVISPYDSKESSVMEIQISRKIEFLIGPEFLLSISIPKEKIHKYAVVFQNYTGTNIIFESICTNQQTSELELTKNDSTISYWFGQTNGTTLRTFLLLIAIISIIMVYKTFLTVILQKKRHLSRCPHKVNF